MRSHTKIGLLVAVHVMGAPVLSLLFTASIWSDLFFIMFQGLVVAQGTLVGAWGALGKSTLRARLCVVLAAIAYLSILVGLHSGADLAGIVFAIPFPGVPLIGSILTLAKIRRWQRLSVTRSDSTSTQCEGLQFSLWHLFALTGGIAVALSVGRAIRNVSHGDWMAIILLLVIGTCAVAVQLAVLWATLSAGRPALRLLVVLPFVLGVGLIPFFYFPALFGWGFWEFTAWPAMFVWQLVAAAASLLVVRSNGWRIVRSDRERTNARLVCQGSGKQDTVQ